MRIRCLLSLAATCIPTAVSAAQDRWSFDFGQGVGEYAVGSFVDRSSHLALSCAEAGIDPGSVSVDLVRAGFTPTGPTPATFITDKGRVTLRLDAEGWARWPTLAESPEFQALWRLLAQARTLRIEYGPGAPMSLAVAGAAELFEGPVCPKQLAR